MVLLCSAIRQGADTAFRKSPTRSFVLCELSYTSVFETRLADELLCRTFILYYCCCLLLETIALHCNAVFSPDALPWLLAVWGRFFAFLCPPARGACAHERLTRRQLRSRLHEQQARLSAEGAPRFDYPRQVFANRYVTNRHETSGRDRIERNSVHLLLCFRERTCARTTRTPATPTYVARETHMVRPSGSDTEFKSFPALHRTP